MPRKSNNLIERDKQVQVRLPASLHRDLKVAMAKDSSSLAAFFNEAAEAYIKNPEKYAKAIKSINGGK